MTRSIVILSPYFPPSSLAGVHRARHLAKHLPATGWTPIVLCVDEVYHEERLDSVLASLVPATTEVIKASAVASRFTRPLGFGEISLRSFVSLRHNLFRLLQTRTVDTVLITGSPFYPMLLAAEVKRRFGVPVVLDFQDPWVSAWGSTRRRLSKSGLSHGLAIRLEPRALRGASFVTSVSDMQNVQMAARYPWLDRERMAAIPIGSDPDDFRALRSMDQKAATIKLEPGYIHLSYVGTIWPGVMPTVQVFLKAVALVRQKYPKLYKKLRLNFVGTTANPNDHSGFRILSLAEVEGVADIVREIPQRLPYLEALSILSQSDVAVMLGSDEPHYTASKIYPYLMSGKPYLSVFHRASSAHEILVAAGGGVAKAFSTGEELSALEGAICAGLNRLATEPETLGAADPGVYMPFEARIIAERYAEIFERLASERMKS